MSKPRLLDLPHGHWTLIDETDWPAVERLTLYRGTNGYVYFSEWRDGRSHPQTLHRYLLQPPVGTHVDHINGDKLDNRRVNLRVVSPSLNQVNRRRLNKNNGSGVRGVTIRTGPLRPTYIAQIMVNHKMLYLGSFKTLAEATAARRAAELEHFPEPCP